MENAAAVQTVIPNRQQNKADPAYQGYTASTQHQPAEAFWQRTTRETLTDPIALYTLVLAVSTTLLWLFTAGLWWVTFRLSKDAKAGAEAQADKMEKSVGQAVRSADAMERVAESMASNTELMVQTVETNREIAGRQKLIFEMQTRAYISIIIGNAFFQEREKDVKFGGIAVAANDGQTPAERVKFSIKAGILPVPLPKDYVLDYQDTEETAEGMIPQHQNRSFTAFVDEFVPDDEVKSIMWGAGPRGLFVWGFVLYRDAFDIERRTDFCHHLYFLANAAGDGYAVEGFYTPGRNTAT